jgi:hydrogenase expression/formation protein HypC
MCIAIPGRIIECTDPDQLIAQVDVRGTRRAVNVALLSGTVQVGGWILVDAGTAVSQIDQAEAHATLAVLERRDGLGGSDSCPGTSDHARKELISAR